MKTILVISAAASVIGLLSGCVVGGPPQYAYGPGYGPGPGYYEPAPGYYAAPEPSVSVGIGVSNYGDHWHHR
jgi:hypothetical protein